MADKTAIEWTDATWNPVTGCSVVSPGCTNCYAMKDAWRKGFNPKTPQYHGLTEKVNGKPVWNGKVNLVEHLLDKPLHWPKPRKIFVNSMGDLFHENVPDEVIDRVFAVMALCPHHIFQVLTKRSERMRHYASCTDEQWHGNTEMFADRFNDAMDWNLGPINDIDDMPWPLPNVWLGTSVEDQTRADERIPHLLATPAAVRFVSVEPLLGAVDLSEWPRRVWLRTIGGDGSAERPGLDWVIAGGESGPGARPIHPGWARSIRDQCAAAGVPFFFKQWGEWTPGENVPDDRQYATKVWFNQEWQDCADDWVTEKDDGPIMYRVGKKAAGALLDGREHGEIPHV